MCKQVMIGLFAMSVVAILWTKADAGCAFIGGSLVCAPWITGSEITNPSISCVHPRHGCIKDQVTVTASVDEVTENGGIPGFVVCKPSERGTHGSLTTSTTTPTDADDDEGADECEGCISRRFTLTSANLPLTGQAKMNCKSGSCQTSIELDPQKCSNCCRPNEKFVTFTATEFHGVVNFFKKGGDLIASFDHECRLRSSCGEREEGQCPTPGTRYKSPCDLTLERGE